MDLRVNMYVVHEAAPDRNYRDIVRGPGGHDLGGMSFC